MRIVSSNVQLESEQISFSSKTVYERLHKWDRKSDLTSEKYVESDQLKKETSRKKDVIDLSENALKKALNKDSLSSDIKKNSDPDDVLSGTIQDMKLQIVKMMFERITGKKMEVFDAAKFTQNQSNLQISNEQPLTGNQTAAQSATPALKGWGVDYFHQEIIHSEEGFTFTSQGTVTTDKGATINFNASLEMVRVQHSEETLSIKDGDALIDPLIIDFDGNGVALSDFKVDFDLDNNGITEKINAPSAGNGFLAYDKNGNGIIDNGSELFGPSTGNGFLELKTYDTDKNGWIDENDQIFSQLKIWEKAADGTDVLSGLLEKDVGAIYTGSANTAYSMINNNEITGKIRESGLWMRESGGVGNIQEVDLVA